MSFTLLQTALLLPLDLAINGVLALDTASKSRLQTLTGKTLALHATQPAVTLYISVRSTDLHFSVLHEGTPAASLHGPAFAMLGLLLRREQIANLRAHQLELRGDTAFVQGLQTLLLDLDIDWEFLLSRVIGDMPTQALASGLQEAGGLLRKTGGRLQEDFSDYLHEEARLLPATAELESFYREVTELKLRADRLQARLRQLTTSHS